jgi:pimeloyl-ACP methyl ester carboxylesterase
MKRNHFIYNFLLLLSLLIISSCNTTDDEEFPVTVNKYLVNYSQVNSAPQQFVKSIFQGLEQDPAMPFKFSDKVKYGVWVYKISYKTKFKNKDVVASGVVCIPMATSDVQLPMLSFQNGTNTLHSKAPSVNTADNSFALIQAITSLGYVVVIPDYLGFGTSSEMFHPYLEKASTVQSIMDMYEAVKEMGSAKYLNFKLTKDLYLMGYSQGAWASMALNKEIETMHSAKFNLKGTAVGGGPYDLSSLVDDVMGRQTYPMPVYLGYIFNSYIQMGTISLTYQDIFNTPFAGAISGLYNGQRDATYINNQLSNSITELFTNDLRKDYKTAEKYSTIRAALKENSVDPWKTNTPLFMRHGTTDTYVPISQMDNMYEGLLTKGVDSKFIDYAPMPLHDHNEAVLPFGFSALDWLIKLK